MKCDKCNIEQPENNMLPKELQIHEHHIHPRFMNNKEGKGKKAWFCPKCHNILHLIIPSIIFKYVQDKQACINSVINFTENVWIKKEDDTKTIKEP
jgi:hypothetical protein